MENVGRCSKCRKFLIAENENHHKCEPVLRTVEEIPVMFYFENKHASTIIARAWNGVLYRLVKKEAPGDSYHDDDPTTSYQSLGFSSWNGMELKILGLDPKSGSVLGFFGA